MPEFVSALRWHWKDRRVTLPAVIRLSITTGTALAPLVVGLPTHYGLVSVTFFLPMVFGVIGAMTLGENIRWLRVLDRRTRLDRRAAQVARDRPSAAGTGTVAGRPRASTIPMSVNANTRNSDCRNDCTCVSA